MTSQGPPQLDGKELGSVAPYGLSPQKVRIPSGLVLTQSPDSGPIREYIATC